MAAYAIVDDQRHVYLHTYAPDKPVYAVWDAECYYCWPDWHSAEEVRQDLVQRGHTFLRLYRSG